MSHAYAMVDGQMYVCSYRTAGAHTAAALVLAPHGPSSVECGSRWPTDYNSSISSSISYDFINAFLYIVGNTRLVNE